MCIHISIFTKPFRYIITLHWTIKQIWHVITCGRRNTSTYILQTPNTVNMKSLTKATEGSKHQAMNLSFQVPPKQKTTLHHLCPCKQLGKFALGKNSQRVCPWKFAASEKGMKVVFQPSWHSGVSYYYYCTRPQTNSEFTPETRPSQKEIPSSNYQFAGTCC